MVAKKVMIKNMNGLHARIAALVVTECSKYDSDIKICRGCEKAKGCSILELMSLGAMDGSEVEVRASGHDEVKAVAAVASIFEGGGGI
jgi:phosphotransferase system HPr (HPr) family protein